MDAGMPTEDQPLDEVQLLKLSLAKTKAMLVTRGKC